MWVLTIASALGRERFSLAILCGVVTALAGMAILILGGNREVGGAGLGDLLVLGAAMSWGGVHRVRTSDHEASRGARGDRVDAVGRPCPSSSWPASPTFCGPTGVRCRSGVWFGTAYAGVFGIALAYLLWSRGVRTIGQSRTAVYQNLVPVIALVTAWLWLSETPTGQQLIGAAVILSGVALARGLPRRRRRNVRVSVRIVREMDKR